MKKQLLFLPTLALALAGVIHVLIAPDHFNHAPAHGLFFGLAGGAQALWSIVMIWTLRRGAPTALWWALGAALSGGLVILWTLTQTLAIPFADAPEPVDAPLVATKLLELMAFTVLLGSAYSTPVNRAGRLLIGSALIGGGLLWGGGLLAAPLLPDVGHNHAGHDHSAPAALSSGYTGTSGYFSIVNAGRVPDALIRAEADAAPTVTLHETAVVNDIAVMRLQDRLMLAPHTRVEFSPGGGHLMIEDLREALYAGDVVNITLHFESGKQVQVPFVVLDEAPTARLNFWDIEDFQISNAWVRATVTASGTTTVESGSYAWQLPVGFPIPRVPADNPMTAEKVELGRYLFYDVRLSGSGTLACASCHFQERAFTDGRALPIGATGDVHPRNSMTLTNSAYSATLTWANPNLLVLERQIPIPMFGEHPVEMGITGYEDEVLARFRADARYPQMFSAAFPQDADSITFRNITLALSSFTRTLISGSAPYDQYLRGDDAALSGSAKRGMALFLSEGLECHHCHTGFNFTLSTVSANSTFDDRPFFNTGLYNIAGTGAYPPGNTGIHEITNEPQDMGRFRPPTLRNIALTAPYMHDGSIATLEEVLQFYADGGRVTHTGEYAGDGRANPNKSGLVAGFTLTEQESADLLAFLQSLTDQQFITDPRFSDPFAPDQAAAGG